MRPYLLAGLLLALIVVFLMVQNLRRGWGMTEVVHDGRSYRVRDIEGKEQVAQTLAGLERKLNDFTRALSTGPDAGHVKVRRMLERWDGSLSETAPAFGGEAAYTDDKRSISVCIRDEAGGVQDQNTATYILLHELAHVANAAQGHNEDFWSTFRFLLKTAIEQGSYVYEPFERRRQTYCGVPINVSEYTCVLAGTCSSTLS